MTIIPSHQECRQLMDDYQMLDNIRAHSVVVAKISEFLAQQLNAEGFEISVPLTISAALLHDIGKTLCLETTCDHAHKGKEICLEHGYPEIAEIVEEHVLLKQAYPSQKISAKEIVYYSDKRVKHDQVVSLANRLQYIIEVYGYNQENRIQAIRKNFQRCKLIEKEIFSQLDCTPDELTDKLSSYNSEGYDLFT